MTFLAFDGVDSFLPSGTYKLQLNPSSHVIGFTDNDDESSCEKTADGQMVESSEPLFSLKTWDVEFTIDNTGAVSWPPPAKMPILTPGSSIFPSLKYFNSLFVEPDNEIHSRKYIKGIWGLGDLTIFGRVSSFEYKYTFHSNIGKPLRAECTLKIKEVPAFSLMDYFMSPDITRIPKVKESDNLIDFCRQYYNDKNYYLKVAEHNNLSSFRKLKTGANLEFPPIKK
jgi:hypothetical protein